MICARCAVIFFILLFLLFVFLLVWIANACLILRKRKLTFDKSRKLTMHWPECHVSRLITMMCVSVSKNYSTRSSSWDELISFSRVSWPKIRQQVNSSIQSHISKKQKKAKTKQNHKLKASCENSTVRAEPGHLRARKASLLGLFLFGRYLFRCRVQSQSSQKRSERLRKNKAPHGELTRFPLTLTGMLARQPCRCFLVY